MEPSSFWCISQIIEHRVDLPEPFSPAKPRISPFLMVKLTLLLASVAPNLLLTFFTTNRLLSVMWSPLDIFFHKTLGKQWVRLRQLPSGQPPQSGRPLPLCRRKHLQFGKRLPLQSFFPNLRTALQLIR